MQLTREFLEEQYVRLRKSSIVIAREIGVPRHTVSNALVKHKIPTRSIQEAKRPAGSAGKEGHRWCPACKEDKLLAEFNWRNQARGTRDGVCRQCASRLVKRYFAGRQKRRQAEKARVVRQMGDRCTRCGAAGLPVACYQFHHNDPATKEHEVSTIFRSNGLAYPEEIEKCSLVCANCHLVLHHGAETVDDVLVHE